MWLVAEIGTTESGPSSSVTPQLLRVSLDGKRAGADQLALAVAAAGGTVLSKQASMAWLVSPRARCPANPAVLKTGAGPPNVDTHQPREPSTWRRHRDVPSGRPRSGGSRGQRRW